MTKMRVCPICGKRPSTSKGGPGGLFWYISCERGNHVVNIQHLGTKAEAIAAWNVRAPLEILYGGATMNMPLRKKAKP